MRDLFGVTVAARDAHLSLEADEPLDEDLPPLPLDRTALPPGTRLVTFGSRQHVPSTCPLTAAPAAFGTCLDCAHCRGGAGVGVACAYS